MDFTVSSLFTAWILSPDVSNLVGLPKDQTDPGMKPTALDCTTILNWRNCNTADTQRAEWPQLLKVSNRQLPKIIYRPTHRRHNRALNLTDSAIALTLRPCKVSPAKARSRMWTYQALYVARTLSDDLPAQDDRYRSESRWDLPWQLTSN